MVYLCWKMSRFLLFLLLSCPAVLCTAQEPDHPWYQEWQNDSLLPAQRVEGYIGYIWDQFLFSEPDSAQVLATEAKDFALEHEVWGQAGNAFNTIGVSHGIRGNIAEAINSFAMAELLHKAVKDTGGFVTARTNLVHAYQQGGLTYKALQALRDMEASVTTVWIEDSRDYVAELYGTIYLSQNDYPNARTKFWQAIELYTSADSTNHISIGANLNYLGDVYKREAKPDSALLCLYRALSINRQYSASNACRTAYELGGLFVARQEFDSAFYYLDTALAVARTLNLRDELAGSLMHLGSMNLATGQTGTAISHYLEAYAIAREGAHIANQHECTQRLYEAYKGLENTDAALRYFELSSSLEDSLKSVEANLHLQKLAFERKVQADSVQREAEAAALQHQHAEAMSDSHLLRNIFLGIGIALLLGGLALYFLLQRTRRSYEDVASEKDKSERILFNILPPHIAQELKEKGAVEPRQHGHTAVLFTDFVAFTKVATELSEAELMQRIDALFSAFDRIVAAHGVEKIKTIGDAYMAVGGLDGSAEAVSNTLKAALELQAFVSAQNNRVPGIGMRVGIHVGPVMAGVVGDARPQYDVWGDTVNVASRMESAGKTGTVNVSRAVYEALQHDARFRFEKREAMEVKGKGQLEMYLATLA